MKDLSFIPIAGFEDLYLVNKLGEIKSLYTNKVLKIKPGEYARVTLCRDKIKYDKYIHRIVAEMFLDNPESKLTVNHKDGNKMNNSSDNLEWATYSENIIHAYKEKLNPGSSPMLGKFGHLHHNSKITLQYDLSGKLLKEWSSAREASRNGFSQKYVSYAALGKIKSYAGFIWKYKDK